MSDLLIGSIHSKHNTIGKFFDYLDKEAQGCGYADAYEYALTILNIRFPGKDNSQSAYKVVNSAVGAYVSIPEAATKFPEVL